MTVSGRWGNAAGIVVLALTVVAAGPAVASSDSAVDARASALASASVSDRVVVAAKVPAVMRAQIPLSQAAKVIRAEIERSDPAGYAGIELADRQIVVWWKGALPALVARAVGRARSIAPVRVRAASHSLRELRAAGARIRAAWAEARPRIAYAVDGSRVRVAVAAAVASRAVPQVGVPVDVVDKATKVLAGRVDDWPPWAGGADQINGNSRCTTGFPVQIPGTEWILTAGHCGSNGNRITDGTGEFMGWFGNDRDDHDIALVQVSGGADPLMYAGDANSNAVYHIDGWDWVYPGELLCQSGGTATRDYGVWIAS